MSVLGQFANGDTAPTVKTALNAMVDGINQVRPQAGILASLLGGDGIYAGGAFTYSELAGGGAQYPAFTALVFDDAGEVWGLQADGATAMTFTDTSGACTAYLLPDRTPSLTAFTIVVQLTATTAPAHSLALGAGSVTASAFTTWTEAAGVRRNDWYIGTGDDTDLYLYADNGDANLPALRYYATGNVWQFSNDGTTWADLGADGGTPGAHASTHASAGSDPVTPAAIGALATTARGAANGVASLGSGTKVPVSELPAMVGDTGSGGTAGIVPAPATGDAAAGKYLKADGTWTVPPDTGGGGGMSGFTIAGDVGDSVAVADSDVVNLIGEAHGIRFTGTAGSKQIEGEILLATDRPGLEEYTDGYGAVSWRVTRPLTKAGIPFIIDGGGAAISTGIKGFLRVPFACEITTVTLLADQSGSIQVDVWKDTYANFAPTDADSITASAVPAISSATKYQDTTLTGWTKILAEGDILAFNVDSCTSITRVTVQLDVVRG